MIAYDKTGLLNLWIVNKSKSWAKRGFITTAEHEAIDADCQVSFYMPNLWVKAGLFIFTQILIVTSSSFLTLLFSSGEFITSMLRFVWMMYAGACIFMAEKYKREHHYLHAGTDNALTWAAIGFAWGDIVWMLYDGSMGETEVIIWASLVGFVLCLATTVRYDDILTTICTFVAWFVFVFFVAGQMGEIAKACLPFIGLTSSALLYFIADRLNKGTVAVYWENSLWWIKCLSLLSAYASVNYFVVRSLTEILFDLYLEEGQDIPFAGVFYFLTVVIPIAYIALGLRNKDRVMLRVGLLLVAVAVFTIRHYHSVLPMEQALTLAGIALIAVAYFSIRYLKETKYGLTYQKDESVDGLVNAEALLIVQTLGGKTQNQGNQAQLGGGQFGGGGASDSF
jgi:hypothetical protein